MPPTTRVYLPLLSVDLPGVRASGELAPGPVTAYAVTPALAASHPTADEEELEHLAQLAAQQVATERRGERQVRRVVVSADVASSLVQAVPDAGEPGSTAAVRLDDAVRLGQVACLHVDETAGQVAPELWWFDVTELDEVIALDG